MAAGKIVWDQNNQKIFETGVDHGVLYDTLGTMASGEKRYSNGVFTNGVAWNGLTAVNENTDGGDATDLWADNIKYLSFTSAETFKPTIEAYTYPDEFNACDGNGTLTGLAGVYVGQQRRKKFGLSYRTKIGNADDPEAGYKLHLVYYCLAAPTDKNYETVNDSPDAITFSWECTTEGCPVVNDAGETLKDADGKEFKPVAHIVIDSTKVDATKLGDLEDALYGKAAEGSSAATEAYLPDPYEVFTTLGWTEPSTTL